MKFHSSTELAEFLGCSRATISNWRKKGLPYRHLGLATYHYELEPVLRWLRDRSTRHKRYVESLLKRLEGDDV